MKDQEKAGSTPAEPGAGARTDVSEEVIAGRAELLNMLPHEGVAARRARG
jgi:hypothetical protein